MCDEEIVADTHLSKEEIRVIARWIWIHQGTLWLSGSAWSALLWVHNGCSGCSTGCCCLSLVGYVWTCWEKKNFLQKFTFTFCPGGITPAKWAVLAKRICSKLLAFMTGLWRAGVSTDASSKRVRGQRCGNSRPQLGKRLCRAWKRGRAGPQPQRHLFTVGSGSFRCCLLRSLLFGESAAPRPSGQGWALLRGIRGKELCLAWRCPVLQRSWTAPRAPCQGTDAFETEGLLASEVIDLYWKVTDFWREQKVPHENGTYMKWRKSLQLCHFSACARPQCWKDSSNSKNRACASQLV